MTLTQVVKDEAFRLGFTLAGVTTPEPPPHLSAYENWLAMGRHASMTYLADPRRRDPRQLLPECKSILVLAMRYPDSLTAPHPNLSLGGSPTGVLREEAGGEGRLASYAWGRDYHQVIPERLATLVRFIGQQVGSPVASRGYTDTGPLLERELAQRAGLGWIGKNTCLIHPKIGSYFFLAEVLLGIQLEADPPFTADRCGDCTRCIEACPTSCLLPDRTMDARRCISYLTIENKGEIPPELRPLTGTWVFGCDVCQQVCPWNQRLVPSPEPAFASLEGVPASDLVAELALTPQAFNRKFKGSPVQRARRRGYLRNVAVALGNSGDATALPALEKALEDTEPLVRQHAAWARNWILEREKR